MKFRAWEAPTRFELVIEVLQTFALPLGYGAIYVILFKEILHYIILPHFQKYASKKLLQGDLNPCYRRERAVS